MNQPWRVVPDGVEIAVRLTPKGGRDAINSTGVDPQGRAVLLARVAAPPVDGAANRALVGLLAKRLAVPKSSVQFISGETARVKRLLIRGDVEVLLQNLDHISTDRG